jgi:hypothetical protein
MPVASNVVVLSGIKIGAPASSEEGTSYHFRTYEASNYGWTGQESSSGFCDRPPATLGVFASLDRF